MLRSKTITEGDSRAPHRSLLRACGMGDKDFGKPHIAICNSYTDIIPGHVHLSKVGELVKQSIREAGGVPFEFNTIGICDGIAMGHPGMKFSLPSRELIADSVESMIESHRFDGMVCIPNCDKIVPGMLMAAVRCNIPTIFVSGGPMEAGKLGDQKVDLITVFIEAARKQRGEITEEELREFEKAACPTCGSCSGMFTANSMNCLCEALGMALPTNGTLLASSKEREKLYQRAAQRIVRMVHEHQERGEDYRFLPRKIVTVASIDNSMVLDMAMGGSTNTVLHMLAVAYEAGIRYRLRRVNELSKKTPHICKVAPSTDKYHIEDVHNSGGIHTILGSVNRGCRGLLNLDCRTVTGKTLGENIAEYDIRAETATEDALELAAVVAKGERNSEGMSVKKPPGSIRDLSLDFDPKRCIREKEDAYSEEGGLAIILDGNLARRGAIVKTAGVPHGMQKFSGKAVIFESETEAYEGIIGGEVKAGHVVVIRYEGPRGGPGMQEMLAPTTAIQGVGLAKKVALITDGRFSGGSAGLCIGHISPEAAAGGPIALLEPGDIIKIDLPARRLDVDLTPGEIAARLETWQKPEPRVKTGWLARYPTMVTGADTGAVLRPDHDDRPPLPTWR